jgi:hypothetical protein
VVATESGNTEAVMANAAVVAAEAPSASTMRIVNDRAMKSTCFGTRSSSLKQTSRDVTEQSARYRLFNTESGGKIIMYVCLSLTGQTYHLCLSVWIHCMDDKRIKVEKRNVSIAMSIRGLVLCSAIHRTTK